MIEQIVIEKYLDESSLKMSPTSRLDLKNLLLNFFRQKEFYDFSQLSRSDVIEMYSSLKLISINSFNTHKSKMKDFALWMYEQGLGKMDQVDTFSQLNYSDVNFRYVYDLCYFLDCDDLYSTLQDAFVECAEEFDTFKAAAILRWMGLSMSEIVHLLKQDLHESDGTIECRNSTSVILPQSNIIIDFLVRYRDADSYSSNKMGGRTLSYTDTHYLIRSYKNAQYTEKQLAHSSAATKRYAEQCSKIFQWKSIYLSGVYYRIYEYEKTHGSIKNNYEEINDFFTEFGHSSKISKKALTTKYTEYESFRNYMYN